MTILFYVVSLNCELRFEWQFTFCQFQCFFRCSDVYTTRFEEDSTRFYYGYPIFRSSFTFTHTHFSRLTSYRFIRENTDPYLTFTLHRARYGDTGCFQLTGSYPTTFKGFQTKRSECNSVTSCGHTLYT